MTRYDIIVIGAGPGGYTAAIRAAQLGAKVALIEKDQIGGTCLNRGCIPTKAILESTKLFAKIKKADQFGISAPSPTLDWAKVMERKNKIVSRLVKGVEYLLKAHKIDLTHGTAKVLSAKEIEVTDVQGHKSQVTSPVPSEAHGTRASHKIILATGSEPAEVPGYPVDGKTILNCTQALELKELPKKVTIIGGGVMGVEFATFFSEAGSEVTIVEMLDRILPTEDLEVSQELTKIFKRKGIKIITSQSETVKRLKGETIILTIGRKIDKVEVNERMETKTPGVYAVGDMTGIAMLAHVAMAQGKVAAENAMGGNIKMDYSAVPWCIFTNPEVARVGLTTNNLQLITKTAKFPFQALGKAQTMGETEGFIKIVSEEKTGRILGATIMGPNATDLIGELTLAVKNNLTVKQLIDTLHAHPTLHEGILEAADKLCHTSPIGS